MNESLRHNEWMNEWIQFSGNTLNDLTTVGKSQSAKRRRCENPFNRCIFKRNTNISATAIYNWVQWGLQLRRKHGAHQSTHAEPPFPQRGISCSITGSVTICPACILEPNSEFESRHLTQHILSFCWEIQRLRDGRGLCQQRGSHFWDLESSGPDCPDCNMYVVETAQTQPPLPL